MLRQGDKIIVLEMLEGRDPICQHSRQEWSPNLQSL